MGAELSFDYGASQLKLRRPTRYLHRNYTTVAPIIRPIEAMVSGIIGANDGLVISLRSCRRIWPIRLAHKEGHSRTSDKSCQAGGHVAHRVREPGRIHGRAPGTWQTTKGCSVADPRAGVRESQEPRG